MRTLFILRGAPGAGKTTQIARHGLASLALGLDDFRRLYSAVLTDWEGQPTLSLGPGAEKKVVAAHKEAVANRLRQGATLLLDATNPARRSWKEAAALASRYGYRTYVIDVQGDLSDEEILARNETRRGTPGYVSPEVVTAIAQRVRDGAASVVEPVVGLEDVRALNTIHELDASAYSRVVFIGDVQSCAGALAAVRDHFGGWDPQTLFVLVGDLFDRGPDPVGVMDLLCPGGVEDLPSNVIIVEGNHDERLRQMAGEVPGVAARDTRATLDTLLASGRRRRDLTALVDAMAPAVALRFAGEHVLVTHAGLDATTIDRLVTADPDTGDLSYDLTEMTMGQLLWGSSSRTATYRGASDYALATEARLARPGIVQVHGHRNGARHEDPGPVEAAPGVYNLEHRVESDGYLAVLQLDADGTRTVLTFPDHEARAAHAATADDATVSAPDPADATRPPITADRDSLLGRMIAHADVKVRRVEGLEGVVACNFTRAAFGRKRWDATTCTARGLFLEESTGAVVARGYDKFFNIGESHGPRDLAEVARAGAGRPITVRRKWNGYLAIVGARVGRLLVLSKSGLTPHAELARTLLEEHLAALPQGLEAARAELVELLEGAGACLTLEVVSRRDPHIVDEGADRVVLLDAIVNQEVFALDEPLRLRVAERFALTSPPVEVLTEHADQDAPDLLRARMTASEAARDEGFVVTYGGGAMTKYKSRYYSEAKAFRSMLERHLAGRTVRPSSRGSRWYEAFLAHGDVEPFRVPDGVGGPTIDLPGLLASLRPHLEEGAGPEEGTGGSRR